MTLLHEYHDTATDSKQGKMCKMRKNNRVTDAESGELFCAKCGFVIDEKASNSGSERIFSDSTVSKFRTGDGTSLTRHDQGLSTIINPVNKDSAGNPLSSSINEPVVSFD